MLFLTKPLGTGIVGTAIKFDRVEPALAEQAVRSMRTLNRAAAEALQALPAGAVHACTDITGFGLHRARQRDGARRAGSRCRSTPARVPLFDGVLAIAGRNRSGGMGSNQEHFASGVRVDPGVDADREALLYDPQTSGGLLVAAERRRRGRGRVGAAGGAGPRSRRSARSSRAEPGVHIVVRP